MFRTKTRWLICITALLLLAGCAAEEPITIVTPLTDGVHDPYVKLSDGFLHFSNSDGYSYRDYTGYEAWNYEEARAVPYLLLQDNSVYEDTLTYEQACEILCFDIEAACAALPEDLRVTTADLRTEVHRLQEPNSYHHGKHPLDSLYDGVFFLREKEMRPGIITDSLPRLEIIANYEGCSIPHIDSAYFTVLPWERVGHFLDLYTIPKLITARFPRSQIGDTEVGLFHYLSYGYWATIDGTDKYVDKPRDEYYAGFYANGVGYTIYSSNGYCTQSEFIQLVITLVTAATKS